MAIGKVNQIAVVFITAKSTVAALIAAETVTKAQMLDDRFLNDCQAALDALRGREFAVLPQVSHEFWELVEFLFANCEVEKEKMLINAWK